MSTELMTATNDSGTISITGLHRDGKPRYQITVVSKDEGEVIAIAELEVDRGVFAAMQRSVNNYEYSSDKKDQA